MLVSKTNLTGGINRLGYSLIAGCKPEVMDNQKLQFLRIEKKSPMKSMSPFLQ
jgi:hypothetical protein